MVEKDVALDVANRTRSILEGAGMQVIMTRTGDDPYHTIGYAADRTNDADPALAVSIHANAGGGTGTEACYQDLKDTTPQSMALARRLTEAGSSRLSLTNRGSYSQDSGTRRCNGDGRGL